MSELIDTTEMYLRTVLELEEEGIVPMRARIAERLAQSGPTVSGTVARMERDGLLRVTGERHLELTDEGRAKAVRVMRKHRLAERLLIDLIGLEWQYVHEEACRWEHVMSDRVERKVLALLPDPSESPYGNPIPGLAEIGGPDSDDFLAGLSSLGDLFEAAPDAELSVTIRRLGEPLQSDVELLSRLSGAGVVPGRRVVARRDGETIVINGSDEIVTLSSAVVAHLFVADGTE